MQSSSSEVSDEEFNNYEQDLVKKAVRENNLESFMDEKYITKLQSNDDKEIIQ
jgi:hypothetical protein